MNRFDEILKKSLHWSPKPHTERDYSNNSYDLGICYLRLNDFPDEIMWTLFLNGDKMDLEELPENWTFTYRSDLDEIIEKVSSINGSIDDFLNNNVHWVQIPEREFHYRSENITSENCFLTMNEFGVDYLWSLYYFGEILNLEEIPANWSVEID